MNPTNTLDTEVRKVDFTRGTDMNFYRGLIAKDSRLAEPLRKLSEHPRLWNYAVDTFSELERGELAPILASEYVVHQEGIESSDTIVSALSWADALQNVGSKLRHLMGEEYQLN